MPTRAGLAPAVREIQGGGRHQLVGEVEQRPGHRELVADLRHLTVGRVPPRDTRRPQRRRVRSVQPRLGRGPPLVVMLVDEDLDRPSLLVDHRGSSSRSATTISRRAAGRQGRSTPSAGHGTSPPTGAASWMS